MGLTIRLYFPTFCTGYIESGQSTNRCRGEKQRMALKQAVLAQIKSMGRIKKFPLIFNFTFYSVKQYPVHNYHNMAQWIIETMNFANKLQDVNNDIICEIIVKARQTSNKSNEGCVLQIEHVSKKDQQIPCC